LKIFCHRSPQSFDLKITAGGKPSSQMFIR
jgi:hypothetical protein